MSPKLVLVPYASAGNGHCVAAQALCQVFGERNVPSVITDVLHFSVPLFRMVYSRTYALIGEYSHISCEAMYRLMDKPREESKIIQFIDWLSERHVRPFTGFVEENPIELSLCTHFLPSLVLASMRRKGKYDGKIYTVITDYGLHKIWVHDDVDRYFVAHEEIQEGLINMGVDEDKITITGIPIKQEFTLPSQKALRNPKTPFTILFSGSAVSDNKVMQILQWIGSLGENLRILLVAGRNEGLLDNLVSYTPPEHIQLKKFGFVKNMPELMAEADLMITKPGGLVVTEALCTGLPMILVSPIPLQETANAIYLEKEGAAFYCEHLDHLPVVLRKVLRDPKIFQKMQKVAQRLAKPQAAQDIVTHVMGQSSWKAPEEPRRSTA